MGSNIYTKNIYSECELGICVTAYWYPPAFSISLDWRGRGKGAVEGSGVLCEGWDHMYMGHGKVFYLHFTVMIHFLQFMNFGSGVTFYKGQAKVKSGHPLVRSAKSIVTTCKQILQNICTFKLANSVIMVHRSKLRVLSLSQNVGPLTHNRNYICSVYTKMALTE